MSARFTSRVCVVTGAGSGIGRAVASTLAAEGGRMIVVDVVRQRVDDTAAALRASGSEAKALCLDVAAPDAPVAITEAARAFGGLDVLCNVAGIGLWKPIEATTRSEWDQIVGVNLTATYFVSQAALPLLKQSPVPAIVNIASVHSFASWAECGAYAATKGAVLALTRSMAIELAPVGIRVNAVAPGSTDTRMLREGMDPDDPSEDLRREAALVPIGRVGDADEVASAVAFLASTESSFTTGACLLVDGGMTAKL